MAKIIEKISLGSMSPGSERFLKVHRYGTKGARPKAYFQASLHADETPGMMVAHHLTKLLDEAESRGEIKGEIILVPVANPIGLGQIINGHHAGRYEMRGGGNFNRRWPDLSDGLAEAVKEKLTADPEKNVALIREAMGNKIAGMKADAEFPKLRIALTSLAYDADYVFDMHCDDDSLFHIFALPQHWPDLSELSAELESKAVLLSDDSGGSSFDETFSLPFVNVARHFGNSYPIPAACRSVTLEFRGQRDVFDDLGEKDAKALVRFLQRRGILTGNPGPLSKPSCEATMLNACDIPRVPKAGVLAYKVQLGDQVKKGDVIAELIDPLADDPKQARTPIRCETSGFILSRRSHKLVAPGDSVTKVVGKEKLAYREGLLLED